MNILFISTQDKPPWGGAEELWSDTALHALSAGHQVAVWVSEREDIHPKLRQLEANGATIYYWAVSPSPTSIPSRILRRLGVGLEKSSWAFARWSQAEASLPLVPDVVCVSQGGTYCALQTKGLTAWILSQPSPLLLLCHSHRSWALPDALDRPAARQLFENAASVCFVAQANLDAARRFLASSLPRAHVVQNPVNLLDQSAVSWPTTDVTHFATVARLNCRDKGQDLLIETLASEKWKQRSFKLSIFGTGPDQEYLTELIACHQLEGQVRLCGHESDLRKIWAEHHLLILPSLSEGTPLSLIEAQLCARPALVTRVDGNPEWVDDGETGFIAEAPSVHHLSLALERAWEARDRWQEIGNAARAQCVVKRDPEPAGALLKLIESARRTGTVATINQPNSTPESGSR